MEKVPEGEDSIMKPTKHFENVEGLDVRCQW
jgi:hypothetical protein